MHLFKFPLFLSLSLQSKKGIKEKKILNQSDTSNHSCAVSLNSSLPSLIQESVDGLLPLTSLLLNSSIKTDQEIKSENEDSLIVFIPDPDEFSTDNWVTIAEGMNLPQIFKRGSKAIKWRIAVYINRWIIKKYGKMFPRKFVNDPEVLRMLKIKRKILNIFNEEFEKWILYINDHKLDESSEMFKDHITYIKFFMAFKTFFDNLEKGLVSNSDFFILNNILSSNDSLYKTGFIEIVIEKSNKVSKFDKFTFVVNSLKNIKLPIVLVDNFYKNLKNLILNHD